MKFVDPKTKAIIGSTALGKLVLEEAAQETFEVKAWRKEYLTPFAAVARMEFQSSNTAYEVASRGLKVFEQAVVNDDGVPIVDVVNRAWRETNNQVVTVRIQGGNATQSLHIEAEDIVRSHLAEPGLLEALAKHYGSALQDNLLIALAGGAEYSPARRWLDLGGSVAIVARARKDLWLELINRARSGAGTLFVPVAAAKLAGVNPASLTDEQLASLAGLDLIEDVELVASWLAQLSREDSRAIVLGNYAYAPGAKHIEVQAVQHALSKMTTESLPKSRVMLTWLATPTDSVVVGSDFVESINSRYLARSIGTKLRDICFGMKKHEPLTFVNDQGSRMAVLNTASSLQGPSYALAKRTQRWMAYVQVAAGRNVAYLVSPPAKTDSVLSKKILNYTYRGAPKFGLVPFEVGEAIDISVALLLSRINNPTRLTYLSSYLELAVHGGLWRTIYQPKKLWLGATVRGFFTAKG